MDKMARGPRARAGTKLLGGKDKGKDKIARGQGKGRDKIARGPRARAGTKLLGERRGKGKDKIDRGGQRQG